MKTYSLKTETLIPKKLNEVWTFFSDPHNLKLLTPPYMDFQILKCPETKEIYDGMLIEYIVSPLLHIPVKWITKIQSVSIPYQFQDTQIKGPFALWQHTHSFEARGSETLMNDEVKYRPPFGILGQLAHAMFIKNQLQGIFNYREKVISDLFK